MGEKQLFNEKQIKEGIKTSIKTEKTSVNDTSYLESVARHLVKHWDSTYWHKLHIKSAVL